MSENIATENSTPRESGSGDQSLPITKTHKLYIGGKFPRSESGRVYPVFTPTKEPVGHASHASRKDLRDAVVAARKAVPSWAGMTAYNRGQVLYRIAEIMEGRRDQFAGDVSRLEGLSLPSAQSIVDETIDRWVHYAGWTDKITSILSGINPVAGPYLSFTTPEPIGVAGILAPQQSCLLGLVSVLAPVLATGCTAVVVSSHTRPLAAINLAETLATADVPPGVVNILTGPADELGPPLATHSDIDAVDFTGATATTRVDLARLSADTVTRVLALPSTEPDWTESPGISRMRHYLEHKTIWHPRGM